MVVVTGDGWKKDGEQRRRRAIHSIYIDRGGGEEVRLIRRGETTNTLNAV